MQFLQTATNDRNVKGSNRVLRCSQTGEELPIGAIVQALVDKFDVKKATARVKLNNAAKNGGLAFGHKWELVNGTPYASKEEKAPARKLNVAPVGKKKKAA